MDVWFCHSERSEESGNGQIYQESATLKKRQTPTHKYTKSDPPPARCSSKKDHNYNKINKIIFGNLQNRRFPPIFRHFR